VVSFGGSLGLAALAFPVYWVTYEYLTAVASPHSTWGNLAYTQMNFLPVIQIASVTGLWGISFVVFLFASAVAALLSGAGKPGPRRLLAVTVGLVLCALLVFGKWRLQSNPSTEPVAVTLIAKDVPMSVYLGSEKQALELLREYADEVRRVTPAGTQVIVLPEKIGRVSENNLAEVDTLFSSTALVTNAAIDLGLVRRTPSGAFNSSRCIRPTENWKRTTTSIISCLASNPKNPVTNECYLTRRPGVGDCKLQRHGFPATQS
jgi:apolipoprotein N-acyltransferase